MTCQTLTLDTINKSIGNGSLSKKNAGFDVCMSYECSATTLECHLNDVDPTSTTENIEDYLFCIKNFRTEFDCTPGQGKSSNVYRSIDFNEKLDCEHACNTDPKCEALDYTTVETNDACRLYKVDDQETEVDGGPDNRIYCVKYEKFKADLMDEKHSHVQLSFHVICRRCRRT